MNFNDVFFVMQKQSGGQTPDLNKVLCFEDAQISTPNNRQKRDREGRKIQENTRKKYESNIT